MDRQLQTGCRSFPFVNQQPVTSLVCLTLWLLVFTFLDFWTFEYLPAGKGTTHLHSRPCCHSQGSRAKGQGPRSIAASHNPPAAWPPASASARNSAVVEVARQPSKVALSRLVSKHSSRFGQTLPSHLTLWRRASRSVRSDLGGSTRRQSRRPSSRPSQPATRPNHQRVSDARHRGATDRNHSESITRTRCQESPGTAAGSPRGCGGVPARPMRECDDARPTLDEHRPGQHRGCHKLAGGGPSVARPLSHPSSTFVLAIPNPSWLRAVTISSSD